MHIIDAKGGYHMWVATEYHSLKMLHSCQVSTSAHVVHMTLNTQFNLLHMIIVILLENQLLLDSAHVFFPPRQMHAFEHFAAQSEAKPTSFSWIHSYRHTVRIMQIGTSTTTNITKSVFLEGTHPTHFWLVFFVLNIDTNKQTNNQTNSN